MMAIRAAAAALSTLLALPAAAQDTSGTQGFQLGRLVCDMESSRNLVVYARETFSCTFHGLGGGTSQYEGSINRVGVDLTFKQDETLLWMVMAPTASVGPDALEGRYGGLAASASLVAGVGAKLLVGGSDETITLQPLSVSGNRGYGATVGVEGLRLTRI